MFTGHIAGFGTGAGVRLVVGVWAASPYGSFADVMVQTADDERVLLAPDEEIADFVDALYRTAYAAAPNAQLVPVPGSAHFIMLDQPQRMLDAIRTFLR